MNYTCITLTIFYSVVFYIKSALHRNYSSLCSLPLRQERQERFNHSNATGIDITGVYLP